MRRTERGEGMASMLIVLLLVMLVCLPAARWIGRAVMSRFVGTDHVDEYLGEPDEEAWEQP